ncbi:MAG TPA: TIGR02757 family protein [Bacteroidia bacterium]|nr:TIGR02757 family protein [Bacteroidia bacterium]
MKSAVPENIRNILDEAVMTYNSKNFITTDPIAIPHRFSRKEDIEIAGFFSATLAWGQRPTILKNAAKLMTMFDESPYAFILNHSTSDLKPFRKFVHRTFQSEDLLFFIRSLRAIYSTQGGLEMAFSYSETEMGKTLASRLHAFRTRFLETSHASRSEKHLSDPFRNSACKRLCMFLRWMVRQDKRGVDFGIWKSIQASELCIPLDVHSGRVARNLGLLERHQNDWKAVEELTFVLRGLNAEDPVKYDFALFGLGVNGLV